MPLYWCQDTSDSRHFGTIRLVPNCLDLKHTFLVYLNLYAYNIAHLLLDFELLQEHIPTDFLRADVQKSGTRHLVLATDEQLKLLSKAKMWYVDATFKVVKHPFTQLFSMHAFVKKDGHS